MKTPFKIVLIMVLLPPFSTKALAGEGEKYELAPRSQVQEPNVEDLAPQSPVTAKEEEMKLIGRVESPELVLQAAQVGKSASIVLSLKNIGEIPMPYLYDDPRAYGFRCRLYDAQKNPIQPTEAGWIFTWPDGGPRLGSSRFAKLKIGKTLAVQIDLTKYFKIPPRRPTEIFLSVWWYTRPGATSVENPYPYIEASIWKRIELK